MNNFTIAKAPLFDFAASCKALNVPESCGIGRDQDGNILSLGPWKRGEFEPRVDIAGPGVRFSLPPSVRMRNTQNR